MEVEKLTGKQPSHQQSLVGKGSSAAPGIKQSYKAAAAFYAVTFLHPLQQYHYLLIAYSKAAVAPCWRRSTNNNQKPPIIVFLWGAFAGGFRLLFLMLADALLLYTGNYMNICLN